MTETGKSTRANKAFPWLMVMICLALVTALALTLRDYIRLDNTRITGTGSTLAGKEQVQRDAATLASLAEGLLAPTADFWIVLKAQMNQDQLQQKLQASSRAIRLFPGPNITVRHAVFLAFDGQSVAARALLLQSLRSFPQRCDVTTQVLAAALSADPQAIAPLQLLALDSGCGRSAP